jgi:putative oxidoreductase
MSSSSIRNAFPLLARLLFAAVFLPAGLSKLSGFDGTVGYIASVGLPLPAIGAVLAILVEIGGSAALLAGWGTRAAAVILALFTLAASVFFHAYWAAPADQAFMTQLLFFKNIGMVGGLLALAAIGSGRWGIDARRAALA